MANETLQILVLKMALGILCSYLFAISTATTDHCGPRYVILVMDIFNSLHTRPLSDTLDPINLFTTHQATVIFKRAEIRSCHSAIKNLPMVPIALRIKSQLLL